MDEDAEAWADKEARADFLNNEINADDLKQVGYYIQSLLWFCLRWQYVFTSCAGDNCRRCNFSSSFIWLFALRFTLGQVIDLGILVSTALWLDLKKFRSWGQERQPHSARLALTRNLHHQTSRIWIDTKLTRDVWRHV